MTRLGPVLLTIGWAQSELRIIYIFSESLAVRVFGFACNGRNNERPLFMLTGIFRFSKRATIIKFAVHCELSVQPVILKEPRSSSLNDLGIKSLGLGLSSSTDTKMLGSPCFVLPSKPLITISRLPSVG